MSNYYTNPNGSISSISTYMSKPQYIDEKVEQNFTKQEWDDLFQYIDNMEIKMSKRKNDTFFWNGIKYLLNRLTVQQ